MTILATTTRGIALSACLMFTIVVPMGCASHHSSTASTASTAKSRQVTFKSAQAAVDALIDGARRDDRAYLRTLFGPDLDRLGSGEERQDKIDLQVFTAAYDIRHSLVQGEGESWLLVMGEQDWTFPAPIIRDGDSWRFDTAAGVDELITRTIGLNELNVIHSMSLIAAAQDEYFAMDPDGDKVPAYATAFRSAVGKRNGLFWPDADGVPQSPLGPLVARAVEAGELKQDAKGPQPYRGYYFRMLTSQGAGAPGGAKNYINADGQMTGGYAVLAWPASYGETGIMSFTVSKDGVVYQKDLGEHTEAEAAKIKTFEPAGWETISEE